MECPACGVELRIVGSATVVTGDASADTPTRVYTRQTLRCINPACAQRAPVVIDHLVYQGPCAGDAPADAMSAKDQEK